MRGNLIQGMLLRCAALVLACVTILGGSLDTLLQYRLAASARDNGQTLARQTAEAAARMTLANDLLGMNVLLSQLQQNRQIHSAHIFSVDNRLLASAGPAPVLPLTDRPEPSRDRRALAPVLVESIAVQNVLAGYLRLEWDDAQARRTLLEFRLAYTFGALFLLGVCLLLVLRHGLLLRDTLRAGNRAIASASGLEPEAGSEDSLYGLSAFAERVLRNAATEEPAPRRARLAACSLLVIEPSDIRSLLEQFEPEQVNRQLRRAYQLVRRCGELHHAQLLRIDNNRTLMVFTDQGDEPAHMFALRCGRLFLMLLEGLRQQHSERGNPPLAFHAVVVAPEEALSPEDLQLTTEQPLGARLQQQASLGSRLLGHAEGGELLVSEDALHTVDDLGEVLLLGDVRRAELRGRQAPMCLYPLLGLPPGQQILLEKQQEDLLSSAAI